ncbi:MAG TPA: ABC transporter permease [Bryobacteraceae bacterium]|nr:ABC transporter permease [Bryobacteraceae bacterium]
MTRDLLYGIRSLRKTLGTTLLAIASLALGIMATTAIYSVVHAVILDPFPYKDVDHLMSIKVWDPAHRGYRLNYNTDQFLEFAARNTIFEGTIASTISDVLWTGNGEPQRLRGNFITGNTFQVMGVPPLLGRWITPGDTAPDSPDVAVLGYKFWSRQFGGDPRVIGRELRLNGKVRTVVGVMPPRFMWRGADVYLPVFYKRGRVVEGINFVHVLGRLKPGVTKAQAEADLRPIVEDLRKQFPAMIPERFRVALLSFKETFPSSISDSLWILFGAVGLLLLIACANVSNLLLAKASARQKEMAVRASLGAGRSRLIRQLLTENLLLALAGGMLGVALAFGALQAILALVPPDTIPDEAKVAINLPVLLFTLGISVLTTLLFGLAPALHSSTPDLANALKETGRTLAGARGQAFLRNGLVVVEVALSLMLLAGASLMIRTLIAMQDVELGIRPDRILTMRIPLPDQRYHEPEQRIAFQRELLRRVENVSGVLGAAMSTGLHPLGDWGAPVEIAGSNQRDARSVMIHQISEGYIGVFGIGMLAGRMLTKNEIAARQHLAIVNQSFVRQRLGNSDALGQVIRVPSLTPGEFQIAGVVRDTLNRNIINEIAPEVYLPYTVTGRADYLSVLARGDPSAMANAVRAQVYAIDKDQPVTEVRTIQALLNEWVYSRPRFNLVLFAVFAGMGLLLAVVGVYGVISSLVSQQTQEIGVRMALGAQPADVIRIVMRRGLILLAAGIACGLIGALMTSRVLAQQIWKVSPFDAPSFAIVSAIILVIGLQACLWPALRAARIDPISALRAD